MLKTTSLCLALPVWKRNRWRNALEHKPSLLYNWLPFWNQAPPQNFAFQIYNSLYCCSPYLQLPVPGCMLKITQSTNSIKCSKGLAKYKSKLHCRDQNYLNSLSYTFSYTGTSHGKGTVDKLCKEKQGEIWTFLHFTIVTCHDLGYGGDDRGC